MNQDIFTTRKFTIGAGASSVRLPISGAVLRYLDGSQPLRFKLVRDSISEEIDLRPGMARTFRDGQGFVLVEVFRHADYADTAAAVSFEVGYGWGEIQDNRAVANISNAYTPSYTALSPAIRSRFVPKFTAKRNMRDIAKYAVDFSGAPTIGAAKPPALNLLAPYNPAVLRRTVRLVSGSTATLGFKSDKVQTAGHAWTLNTNNPERVIDGGENLYGYSAEDCTFVITETIQAVGTIAEFSTFSATLTAAEKAALPSATASGQISWTFSQGATWGTGIWNQTTADNLLYSAYSANRTQSGVTSSDTWTFSFSGITSAQMSSMWSDIVTTPGLRTGSNSLTNRLVLQIGGGTGSILFSSGQTYKIAYGAGAEVLFRVSWYDDEPPIVERCHSIGVGVNDPWVWSTAELPGLA